MSVIGNIAGRIWFAITADNRSFNAAMQRSVKTVSAAERRFRSFQKIIRDLTRSWVGAAGLVTAGYAVYSSVRRTIETFAEFEKEMFRVKAISRATDKEWHKLSAQAQRLGATTKFTATEAAEGMTYLAMAGYEVSEVYLGIEATLRLASAGALDLGRAADIASNVIRGFGLEARQTSRVADVMAETAASSNTSVEQLGVAMSYAAPVAKALGVSLEEAAAAIGLLADAGIQGERGGTGLRGILTALSDPTGRAARVAKRLGVELYETEGHLRDLYTIFQDLALAGFGAADAIEAFEKRHAAAGLVLSKSANFGEFQRQLEGAAGASTEMQETVERGLAGAFTHFKSAIDGLRISLMESEGALERWVDRATAVIRFITRIQLAENELNRKLKEDAEKHADMGAFGVPHGTTAISRAQAHPYYGEDSLNRMNIKHNEILRNIPIVGDWIAGIANQFDIWKGHIRAAISEEDMQAPLIDLNKYVTGIKGSVAKNAQLAIEAEIARMERQERITLKALEDRFRLEERISGLMTGGERLDAKGAAMDTTDRLLDNTLRKYRAATDMETKKRLSEEEDYLRLRRKMEGEVPLFGNRTPRNRMLEFEASLSEHYEIQEGALQRQLDLEREIAALALQSEKEAAKKAALMQIETELREAAVTQESDVSKEKREQARVEAGMLRTARDRLKLVSTAGQAIDWRAMRRRMDAELRAGLAAEEARAGQLDVASFEAQWGLQDRLAGTDPRMQQAMIDEAIAGAEERMRRARVLADISRGPEDIERYTAEIEKLAAVIDGMERVQAEAIETSGALQQLKDFGVLAFDAFTQSIKQTILYTDSWGEALKRVGRLLAVEAFEFAIAPLKAKFAERASGGPVAAGKPYLVGERGPELMVPARSGFVVPAAQAAGAGINVTVVNNISGSDPYETANVIADTLENRISTAIAADRARRAMRTRDG